MTVKISSIGLKDFHYWKRKFTKTWRNSLAHHGVLVLDEMAECPKKTRDLLRKPLEAGEVTISRVQSTVTYPSSFILIVAMNPFQYRYPILAIACVYQNRIKIESPVRYMIGSIFYFFYNQ